MHREEGFDAGPNQRQAASASRWLKEKRVARSESFKLAPATDWRAKRSTSPIGLLAR